jgi:hypothetical protein
VSPDTAVAQCSPGSSGSAKPITEIIALEELGRSGPDKAAPRPVVTDLDDGEGAGSHAGISATD